MPAILSHPDTPPTERFFVAAGPTNTVRVIRHTHDQMEVEAFGLWGQRCRHRRFAHGRQRKAWAWEQARRWADQLELLLDDTEHN